MRSVSFISIDTRQTPYGWIFSCIASLERLFIHLRERILARI
ncbi:hypothetical protein HMPREF3190_00565 [Umbribacter vaginalis]|nr:hypothetical protein HMPREF3190_00565 [Coriobacteriales bacterium DNF00809]